MKKFLLVLTSCICLVQVYCQNVGIGTNTPLYKLDVNGTVNASAGYYANTNGSTATSPMNKEIILNLPNVAASTIEIGNLSLINGAHNVRISVTVSNAGFSVAKMYNLSIAFNSTNGAWYEVIPDGNTGPYVGNDFSMDIMVSNSTASLRLRRTAGHYRWVYLWRQRGPGTNRV